MTIPNLRLKPVTGMITQQFLDRGIFYFHDAIEYVRNLPYGRTSSRGDFSLVLPQSKGTCSTKHALIATLGEEQAVEIRLICGIFEMQECNTPGVGEVLSQFKLEGIPEAHCFLRFKEAVLDITNPKRNGTSESIQSFIYEEQIRPEQIADYKESLHHKYLKKWLFSSDLKQRYTFDQIWEIREKCILALSQTRFGPI